MAPPAVAISAFNLWPDSLAVRAHTPVPLPEFLGQDLQEGVGLHPVHVVRALELVEHADQVAETTAVMNEATLLVGATGVQAKDQRHDPYGIEGADRAERPLCDVAPPRQFLVEEECSPLAVLFVEAPRPPEVVAEPELVRTGGGIPAIDNERLVQW